MSDKTVAELMTLADAMASEAHQSGLAEPGSRYSDITGPAREQKARASLEQAIRRAVDWGEPVARVVNAPHMHMVGPEDGGYYDIHHVTDIRLPDGTPLYARRQDQ